MWSDAQFISQLIHNQNWCSLRPTLSPPPFLLFHLPHSWSHIQKYHAAEQHTLPVSPRPISVVLQHCYLPVMVGFSCLLSVCGNSNCCGATGSGRCRRRLKKKRVCEEWEKSSLFFTKGWLFKMTNDLYALRCSQSCVILCYHAHNEQQGEGKRHDWLKAKIQSLQNIIVPSIAVTI